MSEVMVMKKITVRNTKLNVMRMFQGKYTTLNKHKDNNLNHLLSLLEEFCSWKQNIT